MGCWLNGLSKYYTSIYRYLLAPCLAIAIPLLNETVSDTLCCYANDFTLLALSIEDLEGFISVTHAWSSMVHGNEHKVE
jgi:hypothetical protein